MIRGRLSGYTVAAVLCAAAFVAGGALFVPLFGVQHDEALFAPVLYYPEWAEAVVEVGETKLPTMLMTYVGTIKVFLYRLIFWLWPPSPWSLRLPMLLAAALALLCIFFLLRRLAGPAVALGGMALLASDPMFLLSATLDWGPVALQHLLLFGGLTLLLRPDPKVFAGFLLLGLALWDKATAVWLLAPLALFAPALFPKEIGARLRFGNVARAAAGFLLGALPLLAYNIETSGGTLSASAGFSVHQIAPKLFPLLFTLNGWGLFGYLVRTPVPVFWTLTPLLVTVAVVLLLRGRSLPNFRTGVLFFLVALFAWLHMAISRNAGASVHHTVVLLPWLTVLIALTLGGTLSRRIYAVLLGFAVLSNLAMVETYRRAVVRNGPTPVWSEAIYSAARYLTPGRRVVVLDWGLFNALLLLGEGHVAVESRDPGQPTEEDFRSPVDTVFASYTDEQQPTPGANQRAEAAARERGVRRELLNVFHDRQGRPILMFFRYVPARKGNVPAPAAGSAR